MALGRRTALSRTPPREGGAESCAERAANAQPAAIATESLRRGARANSPSARAGFTGSGAAPLGERCWDEFDLDLDAVDIGSDDMAKAVSFTLGRLASGERSATGTLTEEFRTQIVLTARRIARLRAAIQGGNMGVVFQPIIALASLQLHHHEMLARFQRNTSPAETIRFAEQVGMVEEIDLTMCRHALAILGVRASEPLDLAVNISGKSLGSDSFVEALMQLLKPEARLAKQILFEITESTAITDLPRVERIISELRRRGYRICLDDFGAGASSFTYLQALSVDFVKIDGSYVGRMHESAKDRAILKSMVALCRDLGVGVIAEMVERVDQAQALLEMGIRYGQGYLFGRPSSTLSGFPAPLTTATLPSPLPTPHRANLA